MRKKFIPREWQEVIIDHMLATPRCAVWAPPGAGKTGAALTYIDRLIMQGLDSPVLVLAPLLVCRTAWVDEADKWEHLSYLKVLAATGSEAERLKTLRQPADVYVTNFESLEWIVNYYGDRWPFSVVVVDESTKLKGFRTRQGTRRAKALAQVAHTKVKRIVEMTGTPAPNGLKDLWAQVWFIDAGKRLGRSYSAFSRRWFSKGYDGFSITPHAHAQEEVQAALSDVCLTIDMKDYMDIAEPHVTNVMVDLPPAARALYDRMEKDFFIQIENHEVEAFHAAARSQKLLQLAGGAAYVDPLTEDDNDPRARMYKKVHDAKLDALANIVDELNGMPVLVAYSFKSDLDRLRKAFPKGKALTSKNGVEVMKKWNAGEIPIMFAHPASAAHGLSLQHGGNTLVYFGHSWNLEYTMQILERLGPMRQMQSGYKRPVFVYNIVARDTVDELVLERSQGKREVQDILLDAMARRKRK